VKNGDDRLVVLNSAARSVVEARRGSHATHVFSYEGLPMRHMLTSAWKRARQRAGLPLVRVHDLKSNTPSADDCARQGLGSRTVRICLGIVPVGLRRITRRQNYRGSSRPPSA